MSAEQPFELDLESGATLAGAIHYPSVPGKRPVVLICHGFKGFMDWGFFPYLARLLADRGLVAVRFNFSGCGMRPGDERVTDPEAFARATHSKDLDELETMIDALGVTLAPDRIDRESIGLFGHSRGGGTAILAAGCSQTRNRLRSLVTWSAVSTFDRLSSEEKGLWRSSGGLCIANSRTGQEIQLQTVVIDDLEHNANRLDILAAAEHCEVPWLIVHGRNDETVPVTEASKLADAAGETAHLQLIDGGSHTFGASHPFDGPTPQLIAAFNATQLWLRRTLDN